MAIATKHLPRDIQSKLHDVADRVGERVAKGEMLDLDASKPGEKCSCERYSVLKEDKEVAFWTKADPECLYMHLQPLPKPYSITLP